MDQNLMKAKCFESCNTDRGAPDHFTQVRLANFLSGGFITAIVVNPPERKLSKRTSVCTCQYPLLNYLGQGILNRYLPGFLFFAPKAKVRLDFTKIIKISL